jgi:hypothetical protein
MKPNIHLRAGMLALLAVIANALPALAQITKTGLAMVRPPAGRNSTAFDAWNQVYLVVEAGAPLTGRILSEQGTPITAAFGITNANEGFTGWTSIAAGGTQSDPAFLVTYVAAEGGGSHSKYARLVRYRNGAVTVSGRSYIAAIGGEWYAAEKAQTTWFGSQFIVGTRAPGGFIAHAVLHHVDLNGTVTGGVSLGDGQDYYGSPAVACAPSGVCLATGYAGGIPLGDPTSTASYARLFSAATLQPLSGLQYLDGNHGRLEEQAVVYNAKTGKFLTGWWRGGTVQTRLVATDGSMQPARTSIPDMAGDLAFSYNIATQTTLLVTKRFPADLYALELGDDGLPINLANLLLVTAWDGAWPEYIPSIAANHADAQWLVTAVQTNGGRGILVTGNGNGSPPPPPPQTCTIEFSSSSANFTALGGGSSFTLTTGSSCGWTVGKNASWIILGGSSITGTGSNTIAYTVTSNPSSTARVGIIYSGNRSLTVTQAGVLSKPKDFSGDGRNDLIWQNRSTGELSIWRMNGVNIISGDYLSPANIGDTNWKIKGTFDANLDGQIDLLLQHDAGWVAIWRMNKETHAETVMLSQSVVSEPRWQIVGTGDMDRDGFSDILWQHPDGRVAVWYLFGTGYQVRQSAIIATVSDPGWRVAGIEDFNHDGRPDILWRHTGSGQLFVWHMDDRKFLSSGMNLIVANNQWQIAAVADFSGDGKPDLVWQNTTTGELAAWFLSSGTFLNSWSLNPGRISDTNWRIVGPR